LILDSNLEINPFSQAFIPWELEDWEKVPPGHQEFIRQGLHVEEFSGKNCPATHVIPGAVQSFSLSEPSGEVAPATHLFNPKKFLKVSIKVPPGHQLDSGQVEQMSYFKNCPALQVIDCAAWQALPSIDPDAEIFPSLQPFKP
jgi:hypothetical protein